MSFLIVNRFVFSFNFWRSLSKERPQPIFCEFSIIVLVNGFILNYWFLGFDTTSFESFFKLDCTFYRFILFPFPCRIVKFLTGPIEEIHNWKGAQH